MTKKYISFCATFLLFLTVPFGLNAQTKPLRAIFNPTAAPYYEFVEHEAVGIIPDIMAMIETFTGLEIEYVYMDSYADYEKALVTGDYDLKLDSSCTDDYRDYERIVYTEPYIAIAYSKLALRNAKATGTRVGILTNYPLAEVYTQQFYYPEQLVDVDTTAQLFEKLDNGECSDIIINSWSAQKKINDDVRNKYATKELAGIPVDVCIGINKHLDSNLVNVLNEAIHNLDQTRINNIVLFHTHYVTPEATVMDYFFLHPYAIAMSLVFFAIISFLSTFIILQIKQKQKDAKKNKLLQEALAAANAANKAKTSFLSTMSHEIRTPLNAVIGYTAMAKEHEESKDKLDDYLEKAQLAAKHLLAVINDVLDMTAINGGKLKLSEEPFDLKNLINGLNAIFYQQAKEKGVFFSINIVKLDAEYVVGDQLRVNQILLNLLSNAIKFTPTEHQVHLKINEKTTENQTVTILFEVSDSGIGMNRAFMDRLFKPFEQQDPTIRRKYGGSGLGLSITKNLVDMMKGTISVDSKEGEGTTFTVELPFKIAENNQTATEENHDFSNKRILIVDDDEGACEYLQSILNRYQIKSDIVNSGEKAIKRVARRMDTDYPIDMCIIDWNMPGLNGVETAKQIREMCGSKMPIIIATAYDHSEVDDKAMAVGVNKVLSKPLYQSTVFNLLVNTYGKYQPKKQTETAVVKYKNFHILLAEDNEMNMEIAVDILTKVGLIIDKAKNGLEAVNLFKESEQDYYKCILMDVQMPVMDGYEATKQIRSLGRSDAKTMPIIAMTANAFTSDVEDALRAGMNNHIAKPISYDRLFTVLNKVLNIEEKE